MLGRQLKIEKIYWYLLFVVNVLFCLLFIVLSYYNRLAHDDYYFLHLTDKLGVYGAVKEMYLKWTPRYFSFFITHFITFLANKNVLFLFGYHLSVFGMLNTAFYLLLKHSNWLSIQSKLQFLNVAFFMSLLLFSGSFRIGESWFWLAANNYLLSVIAALFVFSFLLKRNVNGFDYVFLSISSAFVGGSNGVFALFLIGTLVVGYVSSSARGNVSLKRKISLSLLFCTLAFFILYLGPGNRIREMAFPNITIPNSFILNFKMAGIILLKRMPKVFLLIVFLSMILLPLFNNKPIGWFKLRKFIILSTLLFGILVFLFQWPITYKTSDVGAYRALLPLVVIVMVYVVSNLQRIVGVISLSIKQKYFYSSILLCLSIVFGLLVIDTQYKLVSEYSIAVDRRIHKIENNNYNSIIKVSPLPTSGLLYSSEISKDSNYFTNQFLKLGLDSPVSIILKP